MEILILFYFALTLLCQIKCNANNTTISSSSLQLTLRNLCPYNTFCSSSPLKEIRDKQYEPCCEKCSCESDCFKTGSCCPDMPASSIVEPKYPCRHLWHFSKNVNDLSDELSNYDYWYHVIDDCQNLTNYQSYQRCYNPIKVEDYVFVSDPQTGKVYRNKHCAECNDIRSYDNLKVRMDCISSLFMMATMNSGEREQYVMENCTLKSLPPENLSSLSKCIPDSFVISICNTTGSWDIYNKEIERACNQNQNRKHSSLFKRKRARSPVVYFANVYCILCNVHSSEPKIDECKIEDRDNEIKSGYISFHAILDTRMWVDEDVHTEETRCSSAEIFDSVTGTCRQLFCPAGHIPNYGTCKGLFSNINGYTQILRFEVKTTYGKISDYKMLLRFLGNRALREVGINLTCGVCSSTLVSGQIATSQIIYQLEIFAKKGCPYNTLLERIRLLAIKKELYLHFKYKSQVVRLVMTLVFEEIDVFSGFKELASSVTAFCKAPITKVDETVLLFCPAIMLSSDEIYELRLKHASVISRFKDSNTTFQQICVDDYLAAHQSNSAACFDYCYIICIVLTMLSVIFANESKVEN